MSEKLVVVLNVTGEYEAETIDISLIEMYISPPHIPLMVMLIFPLSYSPADSSLCLTVPVKQHKSEFWISI